jgi:hypothetical protein
MAKGQMRSGKEKKKAKQDGKQKQPSAYAQQYKGQSSANPVANVKKS